MLLYILDHIIFALLGLQHDVGVAGAPRSGLDVLRDPDEPLAVGLIHIYICI